MTTTSLSDRLLQSALKLAERGIPVIALRPRSKAPMHVGWPELGMLEASAIRLEWALNPLANVGVLCGTTAFEGAGLTIIDVDPPAGRETLATLESEHGPLPETAIVQTPSGGSHHYFECATVSWNPGPGLEVRSIGRQCAAPPSMHPSGNEYRWRRHDLNFDMGARLPELPAWLTRTAGGALPARMTSFTPSGVKDPVLEIPPPVYFRKMLGLIPDRQSFVPCPFHEEQTPSCKVYPTAEEGWYCYGESCRRGGDIVTLLALIHGQPTPVRGVHFIHALDHLRQLLL